MLLNCQQIANKALHENIFFKIRFIVRSNSAETDIHCVFLCHSYSLIQNVYYGAAHVGLRC